LTRKTGTGEAGTLTVKAAHQGTDGKPDNNSATADVVIGETGPDLYAYAPDVPFDLKSGRVVGAVEPGGTAKLYYEVGNFGDVAVTGIKLTITLPKHATFAEVEPDCEYNSANSMATCTYEKLPIVPADDDTDENDDIFSAVQFYNVLKIAADAPAPSSLTGGQVHVEPIVAGEEVPNVERRAVTALPRNATGTEAKDVDETDNTDEFVIHVAKSDGGGGGLPVTGARAGLIGGVGLGALVLGGVLLLLARRRRVVLVAPADETPTA
jgi:hypothetical protein